MAARQRRGRPVRPRRPVEGAAAGGRPAFFARAGLELIQGRGARDYRGAIAGLPGVEVAYVSSAEIVGQLAAGAAHFGVTGEDLLREKAPDVEARFELLSPLGFGHANVVVAAPQGLDRRAHHGRSRRRRARPFAPSAASGCGSRPNTST